MKTRPMLLAAAAIFASITVAQPAFAAPLSGMEGLGKPVSDAALADMRGKFVAPSGLAYFGVVMSSSWQGSDGITTAATLLFSIDFSSNGTGPTQITPQLMISWNRECPTCGDGSMDVSGFGAAAGSGYMAVTADGVTIPVGSLGTATGVVQSQQIAGSDNYSRNNMGIEIVPAGSMHFDTTGMTALTHGETEHFDDGDTLQFNYTDHQLGLSMTDQHGALQQSVDGNIGQIAQHVLITGNNISAQNNMNLMIGFDPTAAARQMNIQNALSVMKGMGF
jgi:hypothetical protein